MIQFSYSSKPRSSTQDPGHEDKLSPADAHDFEYGVYSPTTTALRSTSPCPKAGSTLDRCFWSPTNPQLDRHAAPSFPCLRAQGLGLKSEALKNMRTGSYGSSSSSSNACSSREAEKGKREGEKQVGESKKKKCNRRERERGERIEGGEK
ncbi:TMV resistance protein N-like [Pyrus ussuriensis x Pyrus communis]|uniref:TMV resistance protein N-like n=1 Tax=Pyrus ussuriensis x Pyrus communis TaxID=2448454 RepID=A0A5N5G4A9_9ROSA|nr:TMV resistance protein N-like [Pyrus ussuriensis x Pyrus communis]